MFVEYNESQKEQYLMYFKNIKTFFTTILIALIIIKFLLCFGLGFIPMLILSKIFSVKVYVSIYFWLAVIAVDISTFKEIFHLDHVYACTPNNIKILRSRVKDLKNDNDSIFFDDIYIDSKEFQKKIFYLDITENTDGLENNDNVDVVVLNNKPVFAMPVIY